MPIVDLTVIVLLDATAATLALLLESATVTFCDGAAGSATVTVADCPATSVDGITVTEGKAATAFGVTARGLKASANACAVAAGLIYTAL